MRSLDHHDNDRDNTTMNTKEYEHDILDNHPRLSSVSPSADLDGCAWHVEGDHEMPHLYIVANEHNGEGFDLITHVANEASPTGYDTDELASFADVLDVIRFLSSEKYREHKFWTNPKVDEWVRLVSEGALLCALPALTPGADDAELVRYFHELAVRGMSYHLDDDPMEINWTCEMSKRDLQTLLDNHNVMWADTRIGARVWDAFASRPCAVCGELTFVDNERCSDCEGVTVSTFKRLTD